MTSIHLPKTCNPRHLAEQGVEISGTLPLQKMARLQKLIESSEGEVTVKIGFNTDEVGEIFFKGFAKTRVNLICQRCMQGFSQAMNAEFCFTPVYDMKKRKAPLQYEALEMEGDAFDTQQLIEDELILNLPLVPRHLESECKVTLPKLEEIEVKKDSPFAVLKKLKK